MKIPAFLLSLLILLSSAYGQTGTINVDQNHTGHKIYGLPTPAAANEAATKDYVDTHGGGGGAAAWGSITGTLSAQTDLQTALDNKQPIDADLTAIAALSGTHNIYYRSASNTWSTVTIGSGLDFTGATLSATGGGGNLSTTGSPLDNQVAVFTDATHVEGNSNLSFDSSTNILSTGIVSPLTGFRINGAAANRRILVGNATNFVQSAETYATPGTSGNVMTSDGTNWTSAQQSFSGLAGNWTLAQGPSITASKLLGRTDASAGIPQEITLGTNLAMSGTTLNATGGGGGTPGGSNTQVQYNNSSAFGGISNATSDGTTMTLTSPKIVTGINDSSANELLKFTSTASAVNEFTIANAAAAGWPILSATGNDTNINMALASKGSGAVLVMHDPGASNRNVLQLVNANTGSNKSSQIGFQGNATQVWAMGNDANTTGGQDFWIYDNVNSIARLYLASNVMTLSNGTVLGWPASNAFPSVGANDTGLARNGSGVVEVNNGSAGSFGTLKALNVNATAGFLINGVATSGKILQANGTDYHGSTPTWPTTAGTAGKHLESDGTNLVMSTPTWPTAAGAVGYTIRSDGTNFASYPAQLINSSVSSQSPTTADVYLAGSNIVVTAGDFKAKGQYKCVFDMTKSAGTGAIVITLRAGVNGTTADAAIQTYTFGAGTSVADTGIFEVIATWRTVGSGTSAVIQGICRGTHLLATTGLFNNAAGWVVIGSPSPSAGFASTTFTNIGLSFNGSTAFAGTTQVVQAQLQQ